MSVTLDRNCPDVFHHIRGGPDKLYCQRCGQTWKHEPKPENKRPRNFYDARSALIDAGREDEIV